MRYIEKFIEADLAQKMVFVGGPRQSGKTTLAKAVLRRIPGEYFNCDDPRDRATVLRHRFSPTLPLIVFDELHKIPNWKRWIKGTFDKRPDAQTYMVTGSARMDIYSRGGDSMVGRYHHWRLHPFTIDETVGDIPPAERLARLMRFGGFPESFLAADDRAAARLRNERRVRIIREDIRDLENVRMLSTLDVFLDLIRGRISSQLSLANLARDVEVSPKTARHWLDLLERMYLLFIVTPFAGKMSRMITRPPRAYLYDNMEVDVSEDKILGARFENLVANHLLKRVQFLEDATGDRYALHYLRDKDNREVDFVIVKNRQVDELIEVKYSDETPTSSLLYYAKHLRPRRATQIVYDHEGKKHFHGVDIMGPLEYFSKGPWDEEKE